jgi:hypothetical protein
MDRTSCSCLFCLSGCSFTCRLGHGQFFPGFCQYGLPGVNPGLGQFSFVLGSASLVVCVCLVLGQNLAQGTL